MLAPSQISSRVVRVPNTTSHSSLKTSSLWMSAGRNVPSGSARTIRSPVASRRPRRLACPYPCLGSNTSRAGVAATSSLVPGSALLLTTRTSSTTPVSRKPSITERIEYRSA